MGQDFKSGTLPLHSGRPRMPHPPSPSHRSSVRGAARARPTVVMLRPHNHFSRPDARLIVGISQSGQRRNAKAIRKEMGEGREVSLFHNRRITYGTGRRGTTKTFTMRDANLRRRSSLLITKMSSNVLRVPNFLNRAVSPLDLCLLPSRRRIMP